MIVSACQTTVTDQTAETLVYNEPINAQMLSVDVRSTQSVLEVEAVLNGGTTVEMLSTGGMRYEGQAAFPPCDTTAEFAVEVTTPSLFSNRTQRFPEVGLFTHEIVGQPDECGPFTDDFEQTFTVTTTLDLIDSDPGDGVCSAITEDGEECSLRAAIMEANASPGADLIRLERQRYRLSIEGVESDSRPNEVVGDLDITDDVSIEGPDPGSIHIGDFLETDFAESSEDFLVQRENWGDDSDSNLDFTKIDGGGLDRVFDIAGPDTNVRLRNLAVVNGRVSNQGGGVRNAGALSLEKVAISSNRVQSAGPLSTGSGAGGGIYNIGSLVGTDVAITQNSGSSLVREGGGFFNAGGTVNLRRGFIGLNDARSGAAFTNTSGGTVTLVNTTIYADFFSDGFLESAVSTRDAESTVLLRHVTVVEHIIGPGESLLRTESADAEITLMNTLIGAINRNDGDEPSICSGNIVSAGGNMYGGICRFSESTSTLNPDSPVLQGASALRFAGGFLPVSPPSQPVQIPELFGLEQGIDHVRFPSGDIGDQRGEEFDRVVDGDGDGEARADAGAVEFQGE